MPMSVITRPLPSQLDEDKVKRFIEEVDVRPSTFLLLSSRRWNCEGLTFLFAWCLGRAQRGDEFTPIEVLRVRSPTDPSQSYYFSLGGCHRCVP